MEFRPRNVRLCRHKFVWGFRDEVLVCQLVMRKMSVFWELNCVIKALLSPQTDFWERNHLNKGHRNLQAKDAKAYNPMERDLVFLNRDLDAIFRPRISGRVTKAVQVMESC